MKKLLPVALLCLAVNGTSWAQTPESVSPVLYFVSDTQQPMMVEKILLKSNNNLKATATIFSNILKEKPQHLYMLGDVVGLGFVNRKWRKVDRFLDSCRNNGTSVCGILGNHEVMGRGKKGEQNFQKRFPNNVRTGYVSVEDSIAVVLLNSNFNTLSAAEEKQQADWYKKTLTTLDAADSIKAIIVCCHHAPFTNSKIVKCSNKVQEHFVNDYLQSKKAQLFITGHAHAFERFNIKGKEFLVIGGGGGLHQPLAGSNRELTDLAKDYKPMFHYLSVKRTGAALLVTSHFLKNDFAGFDQGLTFNTINVPLNLASNNVPATVESTNSN